MAVCAVNGKRMRRIDACAAGLAKSRRKYGVVASGAKLLLERPMMTPMPYWHEPSF